MIAEIKEQMGEKGMRQEIFAIYKRKFPRQGYEKKAGKNYQFLFHNGINLYT